MLFTSIDWFSLFRDSLTAGGAILGLGTAALSSWFWARRMINPQRRFLELFDEMKKYKTRAKEDPREKRRIGKYVADLILEHPHKPTVGLTVFIESGSTTAELSIALLRSGNLSEDFSVFTNNILVSLAFAGKARGHQCHILPGKIDEDYPGIIGEWTTAKLNEILPHCDFAVMNTSSFHLSKGPGANSESNKEIKKSILSYAARIIICFSSKKILEPNRAHALLSEAEWHQILAKKDVHIVMGIPSRLHWIKYKIFRDRYKRLVESFEDAGLDHKCNEAKRVCHVHFPIGDGIIRSAD